MRAALMVFVLATVALSWASAPPAARVHRAARGAREAAVAARPWSAVLRGADGRALARAEVLVRVPGADAPEAWRTTVTDDAGRLRLDGADAGGRVTIRLDTCTIELAQAEALVHLDDFVPLDVEAVDGATGAVLPGAVRNPPSHLARGAYESVDFEVVVPEGYLAPVAGAGASHVSRHAQRVRLAACLRREADVRLRVLDAAGKPVAAAEVTEVFVAGPEPLGRPWLEPPEPPEDEDLDFFEGPIERAAVTWRAAPTDPDGWTRVRGIPQLLDEQFWIIAGDGAREGFAGIRIDAFGQRHVREVRLPGAATEVWQDFRLAGWSRSFRCGRRELRSGDWTPARLEVFVVRRDGRPAVGTAVVVGGRRATTDDRGHAVLERLRPGIRRVEVRDPDFVWSPTEVQLADGGSRTIVLAEPPGWTARAVLLDAVGRPVPLVAVQVRSGAPVSYVRVEDGVQDLVLWTGADGGIHLPRMHHAPVELTLRYGSRTASVTLDENDPYAVVRLPPPR